VEVRISPALPSLPPSGRIIPRRAAAPTPVRRNWGKDILGLLTSLRDTKRGREGMGRAGVPDRRCPVVTNGPRRMQMSMVTPHGCKRQPPAARNENNSANRSDRARSRDNNSPSEERFNWRLASVTICREGGVLTRRDLAERARVAS